MSASRIAPSRRQALLFLFTAASSTLAACGGGSAGDAATPTEQAQKGSRRKPPVPPPPPPPPAPPAPVGGTFVRPPGAAPLLGMNIGAKHYDDAGYQAQLARLDAVVLAFYPGWRGDTDGSIIRRAVQALKALNPALKVGQYTILNEAGEDLASASGDLPAKLDAMNWWLRDAVTGAKTQWTAAYGTFEVNATDWTAPDASGDRWPQWLARRNHAQFFSRVPEFDLCYFDNVMVDSRVAQADWKLDGTNWSGKDASVAAACRRGHAAEWQTAAALAPNVLQMGNVDGDLSQPEYRAAWAAASSRR